MLILSMTQVVPVWHIAEIYQPDVILWLKIVTILLALKGMMKTIWLVRLHYGVRRNRHINH
ncbi:MULTISPECIES: hypothetical protein [Paenibacillus]|uniref:Transmembrane protein n=1 Tax=Paenibacillus favisporus TaxID=221028 RepID=A0ABV2EV53_9BACL|nr:hypothetical protein [Paenibacillus cellulositrophicus]